MAQTLQRTPLHDRHVALDARMVPFAGWEMPVQYEGVIPEHKSVRADCGIFDVSHMGEFEVEGPRATEFLQATLSNDLDKIGPGQAQYTLLTNERGGILDDLIAYRLSEFRFLLVVNAANREPDFRWLKEREIPGSDLRDVSDTYGLLAVQGPRAFERLGLPEARPFTFAEGEIDGIECMVNRTGYTGEEGCELLVMAEDAEALWDSVLGRGAVPRKLVPFVMDDKAVPRQGMAIEGGGEVTSGTHSPMLDQGVGLGYVPAAAAAPGSELSIDVRGRQRRAHVVKRPMYKREERS